MTTDRELSKLHLADAQDNVRTAIKQLEAGRELLDREFPARYLSLAITEIERAELWADKAFREWP